MAGVMGADRRIPALDGLRAVAILLVLARHGVRPFWSAQGLLPIGGWDATIPLLNGWMGVDLFFGLSGFLITRHILDQGIEKGRFRLGDYLKRRMLRIGPAYGAALLIAVSGVVPLYVVGPEQLGLRIFYHLLFLQDYLPANIVVAFWSLGVEEKFYLAAPVLALIAARLRGGPRWAALAALAAFPTIARLLTDLAHPAITGYEPYFQTFRSPFHMTFDGMAVGMICAFITRNLHIPRGWATALFWAGAIPLTGFLCAAPLVEAPGLFAKILLPSLLAVGTGALLLGLVAGAAPARLLRGPAFAFIARLSYSLYLVHMMTIPASLALADRLTASTAPGILRFLAFLPIYGALSLAGAFILHRVIERPFLPQRTPGDPSFVSQAPLAIK